MNKSIIRLLCVFAGLTGGLLAIVALLPFLMPYVLLALLFLISPFMLIYFKKLNIIKTFEVDKSMIFGAISGACSALGFCIIYIPIAFILNLIFKIQSYIWAKTVFINFGGLIMMLILIAMTCAIFNAFSAFVVAQFYQKFGNRG